MKVLVIDVGGSHVKIMVTGVREERRMDSGPTLTGAQMVRGVKMLARGWKYDHVAMGYPGVVERDKIMTEPHNLGRGWTTYDFVKGFGCPVRIVNDAAMQALGGYQGGKMLFLGFGTGLGTAMIVDGVIVPMEVAHLPYRKKTFEDYVGERALVRDGVNKWRRRVDDVVRRLVAALQPEDVVLGGGNARQIIELPPRCRIGANSNAFPGGFRLWGQKAPPLPVAKDSDGKQAKKRGKQGKGAAGAKAAKGRARKPAASRKARAAVPAPPARKRKAPRARKTS